GEALPTLDDGQTYEFEGYETGGFVGHPAEARRRAKIVLQTSGHYFSHYLIVYKGKKIAPIRWSPADFVGREALIEGRAVSEGGKAYWVGEGWKLLTDAAAPWPKHIEGKTAEGLGVIEIGGQPTSFRLAKGTTRLVRLEDQVGQQVSLRGRAWSDSPWFF